MYRVNKNKHRSKTARRHRPESESDMNFKSTTRSKELTSMNQSRGLRGKMRRMSRTRKKNNFMIMRNKKTTQKPMTLINLLNSKHYSNLKSKILQKNSTRNKFSSIKKFESSETETKKIFSISKEYSNTVETSYSKIEFSENNHPGIVDAISLHFFQKLKFLLEPEENWFFKEVKERFKKVFNLVKSVPSPEGVDQTYTKKFLTPFNCDKLLMKCEEMLDFSFKPSSQNKIQKFELFLLEFSDVLK